MKIPDANIYRDLKEKKQRLVEKNQMNFKINQRKNLK